MALAPEQYRAARLAIPRLPLSAILGFTLLGVGGSVFLAYTNFSGSNSKSSATPSTDARVYEARAVPFDTPREDPAQRAAAIARALSATQSEVFRAEAGDEFARSSQSSRAVLLADSRRELRGFNHFASYSASNTYLTLTATSFGMSAQTLPSGFMAPDAETAMASAVPETSTWMCGAALFVLVAARGMRARFHRNRRRHGG